MKKIFRFLIFNFSFFLLVCASVQASDWPIVAVFGSQNKGPFEMQLQSMAQNNLHDILSSLDSFDFLNSQSVEKQLSKYLSFSEPDVIYFLTDAGVSLYFNVDVERKDESFILTLSAFGLDVPYLGKRLIHYQAKIKRVPGFAIHEYSLFCEEYVADFISKVLKIYKFPLPIKNNEIKFCDKSLTGKYDVYQAEYLDSDLHKFPLVKKMSAVKIKDNKLMKGEFLPVDSFVYYDFSPQAEKVANFYKGRKKELVFQTSKWTNLFYIIPLMPVASAFMPFLAPKEYYSQNDPQNFLLWTINSAPYLTLEVMGFVKTPYLKMKKHEAIAGADRAKFAFACFHAGSAGMSLYIAAKANLYFKKARYYQDIQPFMGNNYVAATLSLLSSGGGHFYKGYNGWGYFYYHLDNILMYLSLRGLLHDQIYDQQQQTYLTQKTSSTMGIVCLSLYCSVKIVEMIHAVLVDDNIMANDFKISTFDVAPLIQVNKDNNFAYGLQINYRF